MYDSEVIQLEQMWEYIDEINKYTRSPYDSSLLDVGESFTKRRVFCAFYSWAIPSREAIEAIKVFANGEQIVEIGAGRGLWSALLQKEGCDVRPIDLDFEADRRSHYFHGEHEFMEIERMSEKEMYQVSRDASVLFFCWPCYDQPWAYDHLESTNADKVVYIGEGQGGCNATDEFFDLLYNDFNVVRDVDIEQWWGIHDFVEMHRRIK